MDTEGIPIREIEPDFYHRMQCGIMYANRGETCSDITIWEVVTRQATTFRVPFRVHELAATTIYGYAFGYKFKRDGEEKQLIIQFELANPGKVCRYVFRRRDLKVKIYGVGCTREKVRLSMDVFLKVNSKAIWLAATEKVCYFVGIDRFTIYELCADNSKVFEKVQDRQIIPYRKIKSLVYNEAYGETYTFLRKAYKHSLRDSPCPSSPELSFGDIDETSCTKGKDSVKYIACGSNNLTILTHHGIILAYGTNTKEELGLHVEAMHVVELVANAFLTDINTRLETVSLGYFHGAGVGTQSGTDRRLSLTWGLNPYNQLDEEIGEVSMSGAVCVMKPPDDGLRIKNVVCEGNQTSYFLSETEDSYKLVAVKVCGDEDHWIL